MFNKFFAFHHIKMEELLTFNELEQKFKTSPLFNNSHNNSIDAPIITAFFQPATDILWLAISGSVIYGRGFFMHCFSLCKTDENYAMFIKYMSIEEFMLEREVIYTINDFNGMKTSDFIKEFDSFITMNR